MSTRMYLECHDHTPPIRADSESGQHYSDLPRIREEIANRAEVIAWADGPDSYDHWRDGGTGRFDARRYFRAHSAAFLRSHPHCDVRIITEYGEDVTTEDA
jgi:hypothetical protein